MQMFNDGDTVEKGGGTTLNIQLTHRLERTPYTFQVIYHAQYSYAPFQFRETQ